MKQLVTPAIILSRTDYGEADRILTMLTPEYGKLHLLAKGVRRIKSKLAGGIELFSTSTITFIQGRSGLGTLISTRLDKNYGHIVQDLDRTMLGYELLKQLHKITEDQAEAEYYTLLQEAFEALDDADVPLALIRFWFQAQLLRLGGHSPNLHTDLQGRKLEADQRYDFSFEDMCFEPRERGRFTASHIKFLRLSFAGTSAKLLAQVQGSDALVETLAPQVAAMTQSHLA
ncbi:MAG TPA: DNA repair protein RecO [Candidatus Saccharimonadales bacterium]|nr:DNA repair protein RecO [Candidatus Saccharimonadales bacterium]